MRAWIFACAAAAALAGCSVWPNTLPTPSISGLSATQRVVISQERPETTTTSQTTRFGGTGPDGPSRIVTTTTTTTTGSVTCAEPSPDAMGATAKAISAAVSAPVNATETVQASLGAASGTSLAYIGMRTVMIQAVRDLGYRACEAYMNGAIGAREYHDIVIGSPRIILGLEAIDALAGPAPVPPVVLMPPSVSADPAGPNGGGGQKPSPPPGKAAVNPVTFNVEVPDSDPRDSGSWNAIAPAVLRITCLALTVPPPGAPGMDATTETAAIGACLHATLPRVTPTSVPSKPGPKAKTKPAAVAQR